MGLLCCAAKSNCAAQVTTFRNAGKRLNHFMIPLVIIGGALAICAAQWHGVHKLTAPAA
jgi:hypothetical protein